MSHMDKKASLFGKTTPSSSSSAIGATASKGKTTGLTAGLTSSTGAGRKAGATGGITSSGVTLAPEVRAKKNEEGRDFSERGMKCLKVTVFQWKPDHLLAAPLFESSSNAYKAAGELEQARVMMVQSAKSHEGYGASSTAAVALMNAAKIAQSQQNSIQAAAHLKESSELWGSYGDTDKCADVLAKAAKELETEEPDEALALYHRAMDILAPPDFSKEQLAKVNINLRDILRDAFKFTIHRESAHLKDALHIAKRMVKQFEAFESEPSMCKAMAAVIVIQLTMRDVVQADETYLQEFLSNKHFIASNECKVVDKILLAFKNNDLDMLDEAQKGENLFYFDAEIQPLARQLSLFSTKTRDARENPVNPKITHELRQLAMSSAASSMTSNADQPSEIPATDDDEADLC